MLLCLHHSEAKNTLTTVHSINRVPSPITRNFSLYERLYGSPPWLRSSLHLWLSFMLSFSLMNAQNLSASFKIWLLPRIWYRTQRLQVLWFSIHLCPTFIFLTLHHSLVIHFLHYSVPLNQILISFLSNHKLNLPLLIQFIQLHLCPMILHHMRYPRAHHLQHYVALLKEVSFHLIFGICIAFMH